MLAAHDLKLVSGWYSGRVLENDLSAEKDRAAAQLELFRENGAAVLVYGETTGTVQNQRARAARPAAAPRRRADARLWPQADGLRRALPRGEGAPLLPPPHGDGDRDGGRRRPADEFLRRGGGAALRHRPHHLRRRRRAADGKRHGKRINHVHTKDIRKNGAAEDRPARRPRSSTRSSRACSPCRATA